MHVSAARLVEHGQPLQVQDVELPEPGEHEVILQMAYSGVNPFDMYAAQGRVAQDAPVPRTLGTEGAATVDGRPVVVRGYGVGAARDGLWTTAAVAPRAALIDVPDGVGLEAAAAMGVAGVTAWRTVTELAQVKADDNVLVLGASGGVGGIIVAVARGLGATNVVISTDAEQMAAARNTLDLIIDTVAASHDLDPYIGALTRDGSIVLLGVPPTAHPSPGVFGLLSKRRSIGGSSIGGIAETQEMLDFCAEHNLGSDIEMIRMDQIDEAYERVLTSDVKYRFVIDMASMPAAVAS